MWKKFVALADRYSMLINLVFWVAMLFILWTLWSKG